MKNNMKTIWFVSIAFFISLCLVGLGGAGNKSKKKSCKEHPMLSGPCFKVRGRMSLFNGSLNIRIWPIGTKRKLAIGEGDFLLEGYENLPEEIEQQLNWGNAMFADFTVCPFTDDKPGVMRQVCVESAKNISLRKY